MNKNKIQNSRGITLVALIITIIVMLILVAVSVTIAIRGDLFGITKRAAKETEKEKNAEQDLVGERVKINGIWYDSFEDYVGGKPSEDQKESGIEFSYEPKGWTSGPVKVKIESKEAGKTLQYSKDGVTWENYTEEIEVTSNGTIYAREANSTEEEKIVIENIDKDAPTVTTALSSGGQTITSINLEMLVEDAVSGISEIKWYYKQDEASTYETVTDTYIEMNGSTSGEKTAITKEKTLSGLTPLSTYNIYAEIYDVAGNSTRSPETGTIDITAMDELLGKTATINGQKYIVLYVSGEQGENVHLISANVLEVDNVYLGYGDRQVDWDSSEIKSEADLNNNNTLDDSEKAIYSYNHAVETLNKKCESLVDTSNLDIVGVRSVGSNPMNPNNDTSTYYTSDQLNKNPSNATGKYNGKGKDKDNNYLTDYFRMQKLEIITAENDKTYWLASRDTNHLISMDTFDVRKVSEGKNLPSSDMVLVIGTNDVPQSYGNGVRPVITLKADALDKYLDK